MNYYGEGDTKSSEVNSLFLEKLEDYDYNFPKLDYNTQRVFINAYGRVITRSDGKIFRWSDQ